MEARKSKGKATVDEFSSARQELRWGRRCWAIHFAFNRFFGAVSLLVFDVNCGTAYARPLRGLFMHRQVRST